jgi:hypothetical protein
VVVGSAAAVQSALDAVVFRPPKVDGRNAQRTPALPQQRT